MTNEDRKGTETPAGEGVDPKTVDTVSLTNVKTVGEIASVAAGLSIQNQVANQQRQQDNATASSQRMNEIANQATGVLLKRIAEVDVVEASATRTASQAGDLPALLANLNGAIAAIQQAVKGAITTPPVTS